jgi:hypothetical protein
MLTNVADGVCVGQVCRQPQQHPENLEGPAYWQRQEEWHSVVRTAKSDKSLLYHLLFQKPKLIDPTHEIFN